MALLDPSWLLLGPIWSQNGPENGPQNYPKVVQQMGQKTAPKKLNSKTILGSHFAQFWSQMAPKNQQCKLAGTIRPVYGTSKTFQKCETVVKIKFWPSRAFKLISKNWHEMEQKRETVVQILF